MIKPPTVFHIAHHKTGSQWVREILKYSSPDRFVPAVPQMKHFHDAPIKVGGVYAALFVTREEFLARIDPILKAYIKRPCSFKRLLLDLTNYCHFQIRKENIKTFFVIRDLRDSLVSLYFSRKFSHSILAGANWGEKDRKALYEIDQEAGFVKLMDSALQHTAAIQSSWILTADLLIRYEELIKDEHTEFEKIIDFCEINVDKSALRAIVAHNSFEVATGRPKGKEDVSKHLRKGVAGDWRNYFSDGVKSKFKENFGELLIKTGYEKDLDW